MLLFVRNPYWGDILTGAKTFELRAGARYRNLKPGDSLSLNGKVRATITRIEYCIDALAAEKRTAEIGYTISREAIRECYPVLSGPLYLIHFQIEASGQATHPAPLFAASPAA